MHRPVAAECGGLWGWRCGGCSGAPFSSVPPEVTAGARILILLPSTFPPPMIVVGSSAQAQAAPQRRRSESTKQTRARPSRHHSLASASCRGWATGERATHQRRALREGPLSWLDGSHGWDSLSSPYLCPLQCDSAMLPVKRWMNYHAPTPCNTTGFGQSLSRKGRRACSGAWPQESLHACARSLLEPGRCRVNQPRLANRRMRHTWSRAQSCRPSQSPGRRPLNR